MTGLEDYCAEPILTRAGRIRPCDRTRREHIRGNIRHPFRPWVHGPDGYEPAPPLDTREAP